MIKSLAAALFVLTSCVEASSTERFFAPTASCDAIQGAVSRDGDSILRFPSKQVPGMTLYRRYVRNEEKCDSNDQVVSAHVKTGNDVPCELYVCAQRSHVRSPQVR
jgi:hypothetical protein